MHDNIKDVFQFRDNTDRNRIKEFFINPSELDTAKPTIVLSTPYGTGNWFHQTFVRNAQYIKKTVFNISADACHI